MIREENISSNIASDMFMMNNKVTDGKVRQGSGAGSSRVFKVRKEVYVDKTDVKDDTVDFLVISGDGFEVTDTVHRATTAKAEGGFKFPKGTLGNRETGGWRRITTTCDPRTDSAVSTANTRAKQHQASRRSPRQAGHRRQVQRQNDLH